MYELGFQRSAIQGFQGQCTVCVFRGGTFCETTPLNSVPWLYIGFWLHHFVLEAQWPTVDGEKAQITLKGTADCNKL